MNVTTIFEQLIEKYSNYINKMITAKAVTHCADDVNDCRQTVNLKLLQIARSVDRGQLDRGIEHFERYCYRVILNGIYDYNRSRREISMLSDGSRQVHHFISLDNDNQDLIDVSFEQEYESAGDIWNRAVNHLEKHVKRELYDTQLQFLNDRHLCDMSVAEMAERYNKSRASIGKQTTQAYQDLRDLLLDTDFKLEFDF